ncbi:hypothetical protein Tco_0887645, partial [Tanacetum coccineum]
MPPRMMTRSVGRQTAAPRGGRMGGRTGRGGGRVGEPTGIVGGRTSDQVIARSTSYHHCSSRRWSELAMLRTLVISMSLLATEPPTIQSVVLKAGMLTDEAIRNRSLKNINEKRGNGGELNRNENVRDDNKRSKTGRVFATITNPVKKEYMGTTPKAGPRMVTSVSARNPTTAQGAYFECGGGQGHGNNGNQARRGAFMMGAEEARQD